MSSYGQESEFDLQGYLDDAICNWRTFREKAEANAKVKATAQTSEDILIAHCYIDAFQSVRTTVFGETLP
jgi:hypothetical protein